ncbi:MAG: hypothetical protein ABIJ27_05985 [Candidatus Omnitrophota bacterium]
MKRRKNYFIKKHFQAQFFVKFALLLFFEGLLITGIFLHISKGTLTTAYRGSEFTIQKTGVFFLNDLVLISVAVGAVVGLAAIIIFLYLSHRIGGPLYRFEKSVEGAKKGDLAQRISLRKTDQLPEMQDLMNSFLEEMDGRISRIKEHAQNALNAINDDGASGAARTKAKSALKEILTSLEYFKTSK